MTRALIAAAYGAAIFAILVCVLRWEFRRVHGRSSSKAKPAPQRIQKALARWLSALGDEDKKKSRRAA